MKKFITSVFAIALSFGVFAQNDRMFIHTNNPQTIFHVATSDVDSIIFYPTGASVPMGSTITIRDTVETTIRDTIKITIRDTIEITVRDTIALCCDIRLNGCNFYVPRWGESLGTISFHTNNVWHIQGNGISQIWSDAVTATACQKTGFAGGSTGNFNADCRSNPEFPGDLFSWCAVARFRNQLCPHPWRVPTRQDFIDLDIALGGTGHNRVASISTPEFVQDNYIIRWGGTFGGYDRLNLSGQGSVGFYWSLSERGTGSTSAYRLRINIDGAVQPQHWTEKWRGFSLRCVR